MVYHYGRVSARIGVMRPSIVKAALTLLLSGATVMFAQTAKDDMKKAGKDTKEAGKATGSAAKETGKATAKTAKTAGKKVKHGTNKAASKVEEKTRDKQ
jgi:hypothetical protein